MDKIIEEFFAFLEKNQLSVGYFFGFFFICLCIYHWEKIEYFFNSIKNGINFSSKKRELENKRNQIEEEINHKILVLDKEIPGLFNNSIRIHWSTSEDTPNIQDRSIIVRVRDKANPDCILIDCIKQLLDISLLVESRIFLHSHVFLAIKILLLEKFLQDSKYKSAITRYKNDYYEPTLSKNKELTSTVNKLEFIDHQGVFTRIFLREIQNLHENLGVHHETTTVKWDVLSFIDFIYTLFFQIHDNEFKIDFEFNTKSISSAIALLAEEYRLSEYGLAFYRKRTLISIINGARTVYFIGANDRNIKIAKSIATWFEKQGIIESTHYSFFKSNIRAKKSDSLCIYGKVSPKIEIKDELQIGNHNQEILINDEDLIDVLNRINPQIRNKNIQIIKTARIVNKISLVLVKHSSQGNRNPIPLCVGPRGVLVERINDEIGGFVKFAEWSSDTKKAIISCLFLNKIDYDFDLSIDEPTKLAVFQFSSMDDLTKFKNNFVDLLKLIEVIFNYSIDFKINFEKYFSKILEEQISEIKNAEIRIKKIVIIPSFVIKIEVSSASINNPAIICKEYINKIREIYRGNEWILFCNYYSDIENRVIASLYPIIREDIQKIQRISNNYFTVYLKDQDKIPLALGKEGSNLKSAEKLIGCRINIKEPE